MYMYITENKDVYMYTLNFRFRACILLGKAQHADARASNISLRLGTNQQIFKTAATKVRTVFI